jgi:hypothetical protein
MSQRFKQMLLDGFLVCLGTLLVLEAIDFIL